MNCTEKGYGIGTSSAACQARRAQRRFAGAAATAPASSERTAASQRGAGNRRGRLRRARTQRDAAGASRRRSAQRGRGASSAAAARPKRERARSRRGERGTGNCRCRQHPAHLQQEEVDAGRCCWARDGSGSTLAAATRHQLRSCSRQNHRGAAGQTAQTTPEGPRSIGAAATASASTRAPAPGQRVADHWQGRQYGACARPAAADASQRGSCPSARSGKGGTGPPPAAAAMHEVLPPPHETPRREGAGSRSSTQSAGCCIACAESLTSKPVARARVQHEEVDASRQRSARSGRSS